MIAMGVCDHGTRNGAPGIDMEITGRAIQPRWSFDQHSSMLLAAYERHLDLEGFTTERISERHHGAALVKRGAGGDPAFAAVVDRERQGFDGTHRPSDLHHDTARNRGGQVFAHRIAEPHLVLAAASLDPANYLGAADDLITRVLDDLAAQGLKG